MEGEWEWGRTLCCAKFDIRLRLFLWWMGLILLLPSFPPPPCNGANSPATTTTTNVAVPLPLLLPTGVGRRRRPYLLYEELCVCCVVVVAAVAPFDLIVEPETFVKSPMGNAWASRGEELGRGKREREGLFLG